VITFRPFRNSDPPQLAEIWRSQPASRGLVQPMSAAIFERQVLNSPMFEREGLIVAAENERLLGFVHAGFGPTDDKQHISTAVGATCVLMVRPLDAPLTLADDLLIQSERYLANRGAQSILAGGVDRWGPFYLGLTGGSVCSTVLDSDRIQQDFLTTHGYIEDARALVLHCDLARFRPPVDRRQLLVRRRTTLQVVDDPTAKTWWECSTLGSMDQTRFDLLPREGGPALADVTLWNMDLLGATWGVRAAGLTNLEVLLGSNRRQGLAVYIVAEALRHFQQLGVMLVETQVEADNQPAQFLFRKLGFVEVDQAVRYRKPSTGNA
jgi:RimJ/RimL family protein N-acetyltransferase